MEITKNYFNQLDAIVLVFDMTSGTSFEGVLRWYKQIKEAKECPLIIVGNKADVEEQIILTNEELKEVSDFCMVPCYKVSALTGTSVDDAFMSII